MAYKRSIGLVGLAGAGKSVFLTSVIDHLKNHEAHKLQLTPLKRGRLGQWLFGQAHTVEIRKFHSSGAEKPFVKFEYEKFRDALVEQTYWPDKTRDVYHYACRFHRSDWKERVELDFLDFPGERVADATIFKTDYADWSDAILKHFDSDSNYRELTGDFLRLQREERLDIPKLVLGYKVALARLLQNYLPLISPSVFSLDRNGKQISMPKGATLEKVAAKRMVGLSRDEEFVPLSAEARGKNPEVLAAFQRHYENYRREVVTPLFNRLGHCDQLVVLVDIVEILAANVRRYNETRLIIKTLLDACDPGGRPLETMFGSVTSLFGWRINSVKQVAFVASKADLVRYSEVTALRGLLKDMVKNLARDYDVRQDFFTCSAIRSTTAVNGRPEELAGYPLYGAGGVKNPPPKRGDPVPSFRVSSLPQSWPEEWDKGNYGFRSVYPRVPRKQDEPPDQEGLNLVLDFVMGAWQGEESL